MPSKPIKLLIVVVDLDGGTGTFCRLLADGLTGCFAGEFSVSLLLLRDRGVVPADRVLFSRIHVVGSTVHSDLRRFYETPLHALKVRKALKGIEADLILTVGTYANVLVPLTAPTTAPVILSVHTHQTTQLARSRFGGLTARVIRRRYGRHPIVAPTRGVAEDLHANFGVPADHTRVIPHGIDVARANALAGGPIEGAPTGRPYAIAVGRLTLQKDYPTLLRAYASMCRSVNDDLVILGDGEQRPSLEDLARSLGLDGRVHFLGHRPNPFPYLRRAQYYVLSSIWEGFGLSLLEAMAVGLPCVATDCPSGPSEILEGGGAGLLVPPSDPDALAAAMVRLSTLKAVRWSVSQHSRRRAQELSLANMVRQYRELFLGYPRQGA